MSKHFRTEIFTADWWRLQRHELKDIYQLITQSRLPRLIIILFVICFTGAGLILLFESEEGGFADIFDSVWWSLVTMTTVGYGDMYPLTGGGRLLAGFLMLSGIAVVSLFTATVSSVFVATKLREERGLQNVFYKGHLVILGWNDSGLELVQTLLKQEDHAVTNKIVLINSLTPEATEELQQVFKSGDVKFLKGDYTGTAVLNRAKTTDARAILILSEQSLPPEAADERTVLATLTVKSMNSRVKVYVHLRQRGSEGHVKRAGADRVIISDKYTGYLLANCAAAPNIPKVIDDILGIGSGSMLKSMTAPKGYIGKTFGELAEHLKKSRNMLLLGFIAGENILRVDDILSDDISSVDDFIKRKFMEAGRSPEELETTLVNLNPPLDYQIRENDLAIVLGGN